MDNCFLFHRHLTERSNLMMIVDKIALCLTVIGALNWGSIGIFGFDFVSFWFGGQGAWFPRIIFTLVGIAGLWCISMLFRPTEE